MKTPTLKEVKEYFKDAEEVKSAVSGVKGFINENSEFKLKANGSVFLCNEERVVCLYGDSNKKYAEITKYKSTNKVKNPNAKHYELWQDFEAIDIIKATLTEDEYLGYLKGNIIKYKLRDKGQDESDKVKIKDYTNELNNLINK